MGISLCGCIEQPDSMKISDWIAVGGIVVNAILAVVVIITVQNKFTNRRVLKDHFIDEVKEIRNEYNEFLTELRSNTMHPHKIIPWFKIANLKVNDLMKILNKKYNINQNHLKPYQVDLNTQISNNVDFIAHYTNSQVIFSTQSRNEIIRFQQKHNKLFNDLIVLINDSK